MQLIYIYIYIWYSRLNLNDCDIVFSAITKILMEYADVIEVSLKFGTDK